MVDVDGRWKLDLGPGTELAFVKLPWYHTH